MFREINVKQEDRTMNTINYKNDILPVMKKAGKIINRNFGYKRECQEKSYANYVTD